MEVLNQALECYKNSDYEGALNLLRLCESNPIVNRIYQECVKGLTSLYQFDIENAEKRKDNATVKQIIQKYQQYIGQDDFLIKHTTSNSPATNASTYVPTDATQEIIINNNESSSIVSMLDALILPNAKKLLAAAPIIVIVLAIFGATANKTFEGEFQVAMIMVAVAAVIFVLGFAINYMIVRGCNTNEDSLNLCLMCYGGSVVSSILSWYFLLWPTDLYILVLLASVASPILLFISIAIANSNGINVEFKTKIVPWAFASYGLGILSTLSSTGILLGEIFAVLYGIVNIVTIIVGIVLYVKLYKNAHLICE